MTYFENCTDAESLNLVQAYLLIKSKYGLWGCMGRLFADAVIGVTCLGIYCHTLGAPLDAPHHWHPRDKLRVV